MRVGWGGVRGIQTVLHTKQKAKELGEGSYFLPSEYEFQTFGVPQGAAFSIVDIR